MRIKVDPQLLVRCIVVGGRDYSPTEVKILAGAEVRAGAEVCNLAGAGSEAGVGYLTETEAGAEFRVSEVA